MEQNCEIAQDLLPLYADGVCSEPSKNLVEAHLAGCPACRQLLTRMRGTLVETVLELETARAMENHRTVQRRKSAVTGIVFAGIFALPLLICLIVNLASGRGLNWFFIVLAALMIPFSMIALPLLLPKYRFLYSSLSTLGSLVLLLGVCALYAHGKWFFVASTPLLLFYGMVFFPILLNREPLKSHVRNCKGLLYMAVNTVLLLVMLLCIGLLAGQKGYFRTAAAITAPLLFCAWGAFLLLRYVKLSGLVRAGLCVLFLSLCCFFFEAVVGMLLRSPVPLPTVFSAKGFLQWGLLCLHGTVGVILLMIGLIREVKK